MYKLNDIKQIHLEITQNCQASCPMCDRNQNGGALNPHIKLNDNTKSALHIWDLSDVDNIKLEKINYEKNKTSFKSDESFEIDYFILKLNDFRSKRLIKEREIRRYYKKNISNLVCFREKKPLGTFGALANVATRNISDQYLTINGDTIFKADMRNIYDRFNNNSKNQALIVLKESPTNDRYGG